MKARDLLAEIEGFRLTGPDLFGEWRRSSVEELAVDGTRVPRITNELWTARQRQGHSLHELSYRACFKAELPRFFVERLTREGERVLDPFMGRGTTLLEAALHGRVPAGNDASPLARVLIEPRLDPPSEAQIDGRIAMLAKESADPGGEPGDPELGDFFEEETLGELRGLRSWFAERESAGDLDATDRWLRMVATNRLHGHSSGFFSVRTMPPNQAVSAQTQRKLNDRAGRVPPRREVWKILAKKSRSLLRGLRGVERAHLSRVAKEATLLCGDAGDLASLADETVSCTITSPPFLDVVDYRKDNWIRCWFNGIDVEAVAQRLTTPRKLDAWRVLVARCFAELMRVTVPGGWVVFEVGEVHGGRVLLEEPVLPIGRDAGFDPVGVVVNAQNFTKTANCWGVSNNVKGTNTNRLVLFRKGPG